MLEAAELHALGARALEAAGDESGARAAQARADDARKRLRAALPASLQPGFDAATRVATP
jgi:hypothetical protein